MTKILLNTLNVDEEEMKVFPGIIIVILALSMTASRPHNLRTEYYYSLTMLRDASPPENIRLVMVNNLSTDRSVVSEGTLFTYKDRRAKSVQIGGNFSSWKTINMTRGKDGVWFYFLSTEDFSGKIRYKYNVDGLWTDDPRNALNEYDRAGSYLSIAENRTHDEGRLLSLKFIDRNRVQFRLYKPDARIISIVGDFNGWNPENDLMKRGDDGVWRLEKRLPRGEYRYQFIIDGEWKPDIFNPLSASDNTGGICSLLRVK